MRPLCITLLICLIGMPAVSQELYDLKKEEVETIKQDLLRDLKDPYSAQFSGIVAIKKFGTDDTFDVCGYVNAKNSYGGYVGNMPFSALLMILKTKSGEKIPFVGGSMIAKDEYVAISIRDFCIKNGLPM